MGEGTGDLVVSGGYDGTIRTWSRTGEQVAVFPVAGSGISALALDDAAERIVAGYDRKVRFLVADSDNAPLGGGDYYDGIYLFLNGTLTPIYSANE